uniref:glucan endo-1,3-beta-glucosidase 3-like isoform X1 n=1 Tax=Erigeron canadensis TaxID=72917 RepID=UPI001CB8E8FD|nr:glucan endo-1,3-beta-glucosidase 3-like isoform X1 [Erigeron canadensis]
MVQEYKIISQMVINIFFVSLLLVPLAVSADQGSVLANDTTGKTFCVAKENADKKMLQAALDWACGPGKVNCSTLLEGELCHKPDTVVAHASYAFDAYYHQMSLAAGTCDFNGVATITTTDPSHGDCIFPGSGRGG